MLTAPRVDTPRFTKLCLRRCHASPSDQRAASAHNVSVDAHCDDACEKLGSYYRARDAKKDTQRQRGRAAAQAALLRMQHLGTSSWYHRTAIYSHPTTEEEVAVCRGPVLLPNRSSEVVNATVGMRWRYYSLIECAEVMSTETGPMNPSPLCLIFKSGSTATATIHSLQATDEAGLDFRASYGGQRWQAQVAVEEKGDALFSNATPAADAVITDLQTNDRRLAHNLAVLALAAPNEGKYILAGGMGPRFDATASTARLREGIRFAQGVGWPPWSKPGWLLSEVVVDGAVPSGCVDRRLRRIASMTQWSQGRGSLGMAACEFDGRLSLIQLQGGGHRLYARANVLEQAVAGGRFVQTTATVGGLSTGNWTPWTAIRILGLPPGSADLYFFHVQRNPIDPSSLIALFPLSQPPDACIAMAFSTDGREFSRPVNLQRHRLGWRTGWSDGGGPLEWRNEDHPVAGVVLRRAGASARRSGAEGFEGLDDDELWLYLHHEVIGTSMRPNLRPHVARYRLSKAAVLQAMCNAALPPTARPRRPRWVRSACQGLRERQRAARGGGRRRNN